MNLQIINNDLALHGIVTGYESIEFTRAWNSKGSFKIKINANNNNAKYLEIDKIVLIDSDKIGYIEKITIDRKTDKSGEFIIAEGVELKDRLNRVIYPAKDLESDSYTSEDMETIVKSLIQKNASGSESEGLIGVGVASEKRQIPYLIVANNQNRGLKDGTETINYSARYKDLSTEIYSLLSSMGMGLKAKLELNSKKITFDVDVGEDKTAKIEQAGGIVLSLGNKTALEVKDVDDKLSYKNLSVTAGLGEGADRTIQEVHLGAPEDEPTGYERREVFTEARDIENDNELSTRGAQKLSEIAKTRSVSVKANTLGAYQVGDDYDLGDFISVDANGSLFEAQVTKLKYKFSKESIPQIDVILNFDVEDTLIADITARNMDYDALVSSSSRGNLVASVKVETQASSITIDGLDIFSHNGALCIIIKAKNRSGTGVGFPAMKPNNFESFNAARSQVYDIRTTNGAMSAPSGNDWYAYFSLAAPLGQTDESKSGMIKATLTQDTDYNTSVISEFEIIDSGLQRIGTYRSEGKMSEEITSLTFYMTDEFVAGSLIQVWEM